MITIYYLTNPLTEEIFYIGKTSEKLNKRLSCHITACKQLKTPTHRKVYEIISKGCLPKINILQKNIPDNTRDDWKVASKIEKRWINYFVTDYPLTNIIGIEL